MLSSVPEPDDVPELDITEFRDTASQVLLSSQFPSDAVPVRSGKRLSTFVGVFVGVGVLVVGVTIWWLSGRSSRASESASPAATAAPAQPANSAAAKRPSSEPGSANNASDEVGEPVACG